MRKLRFINPLLLLLPLLLSLLVGCATVKPWQREYLSEPTMQFNYNKEAQAARDKFLGPPEGSTGGFGPGGGGCGCN